MLVAQVVRDRGYPVDDFEQRAADVSVDPSPGRRELPRRPRGLSGQRAGVGQHRRPMAGVRALPVPLCPVVGRQGRWPQGGHPRTERRDDLSTADLAAPQPTNRARPDRAEEVDPGGSSTSLTTMDARISDRTTSHVARLSSRTIQPTSNRTEVQCERTMTGPQNSVSTRSRLESQWDRGDDVPTDDLRHRVPAVSFVLRTAPGNLTGDEPTHSQPQEVRWPTNPPPVPRSTRSTSSR